MIVMLKDNLNIYFAYSEIELNFNNLESNHKVHLRGLMWKEPIKRWKWRSIGWEIQHEDFILQTRKINQNLVLQMFWNQMKEKEMNWLEATLL